MYNFALLLYNIPIPDSLVVMISACHADGRRSIRRQGEVPFWIFPSIFYKMKPLDYLFLRSSPPCTTMPHLTVDLPHLSKIGIIDTCCFLICNLKSEFGLPATKDYYRHDLFLALLPPAGSVSLCLTPHRSVILDLEGPCLMELISAEVQYAESYRELS